MEILDLPHSQQAKPLPKQPKGDLRIPPKKLPKGTETEPVSISSGNNTPISGLSSILDSLLRGVGRYIETFINNYFVRLLFRFATENVRYGSSRSLQKMLAKENLDKETWKEILTVGFKKSLEIAIGTGIIDPNRQKTRLVRMGTGFLNQVARTAVRAVMLWTKVLNKNQFSLKTLVDEFLARTICRFLYIDSDNPILGIGWRTVEQLGINKWMKHLPFNNMLLPMLYKANPN